jgi:hypothetical protein
MLSELTSIMLSWVTTLTFADKAVLVFVLLFHRVMAMLGIWTYALFTLLGTIFHEGLHWACATVLGANPSFPRLIPERTPTGWRLGSVSFTPGLLKNIPIALAPFLLAPFGLWWAAEYMHLATGWWYVMHAWIAGTVIMASLPSSQDWKIAAPALILCAIGLVAYYFRAFL